jgi:hypothetical protein
LITVLKVRKYRFVSFLSGFHMNEHIILVLSSHILRFFVFFFLIEIFMRERLMDTLRTHLRFYFIEGKPLL